LNHHGGRVEGIKKRILGSVGWGGFSVLPASLLRSVVEVVGGNHFQKMCGTYGVTPNPGLITRLGNAVSWGGGNPQNKRGFIRGEGI